MSSGKKSSLLFSGKGIKINLDSHIQMMEEKVLPGLQTLNNGPSSDGGMMVLLHAPATQLRSRLKTICMTSFQNCTGILQVLIWTSWTMLFRDWCVPNVNKLPHASVEALKAAIDKAWRNCLRRWCNFRRASSSRSKTCSCKWCWPHQNDKNK